MNIEITQHKQVGSDVAGVLNNDHAQAAEEFLLQAHFDDWMVVVADDKKLMLDYDQQPYDGTLPEQYFVTMDILEEMLGYELLSTDALASKGIVGGISTLSVPDIAELRSMVTTIWYDTLKDSSHLLLMITDPCPLWGPGPALRQLPPAGTGFLDRPAGAGVVSGLTVQSTQAGLQEGN